MLDLACEARFNLGMAFPIEELDPKLRRAVATFWQTRFLQAQSQTNRGVKDQGSRGAATGGAQMNGFCQLIAEIIGQSGIPDAGIFCSKSLELPGFYRPTKKWDMVVVVDGKLLAVIEAKSQVGPSFGNNFNNRVEEAIGSATDFWTAFREGAFSTSPKPWLGYLFLLEDCENSRSPVKANEPHFSVFDEFQGASYAKRYELFCKKLVRECLYQTSAFLSSSRSDAKSGDYREPADDLSFRSFAASLIGHASAYASLRGKF